MFYIWKSLGLNIQHIIQSNAFGRQIFIQLLTSGPKCPSLYLTEESERLLEYASLVSSLKLGAVFHFSW